MAANSIKVAFDLSKGIAVHATGTPAKIVAAGAAAALTFVGLFVALEVYERFEARFPRRLTSKAPAPERLV